MYDAQSIIVDAREQSEFQITRALRCAQRLRDAGIPYNFGSKTEEAIDCSGLTRMCYQTLEDGVIYQYNQLRDWLYYEQYLSCGREGDLIFFSSVGRPAEPSHVGIISQVDLQQLTCLIIEASSVKGRVVEQEFDLRSNSFGMHMVCNGIAKVRPFLERQYIQEQIKKLAAGTSV